MLGEKGGYLLTIGSDKEELKRLSVDAPAAKTLGVDAGPLSAARFARTLTNPAGTGVLELLKQPAGSPELTARLAALWQVLIPAAEQKLLLGGQIRRLIVIPDGTLALLPFETLVVEPGKKPKYLLDAGPTILYAPSAAVLYNLSQRRPGPAPAGREPVLTVGNANYGDAGASPAATSVAALGPLTSRGRYATLGGKLGQLPSSAWEIQWVAESFGKLGMKVLTLAGAEATKANFRAQAAGRQIVHLACYGLADESYGNFFGALALSPGQKADDPTDDGFLTLPEIYQLNLRECQLAILSACETNCGPEQHGEGVWALSRGFLVAGARRVVASDWLVDDEAAASLVSYFCGGVAQGTEGGHTPDYAEALTAAKRWVHGQEKWQSPYYWAPFVLVGPH